MSYVLVTTTTSNDSSSSTPSDNNNRSSRRRRPSKPKITIKKQIRITRKRRTIQEKDNNNNPNLRIKEMNPKTISSIISRTKYQIRLLDEGGYSRGESHRKHIKKRFAIISNLQWKDDANHRICCDRCNQKIEMGDNIVIHKRRSYNRFFHKGCAKLLNLV